MPRSIFMLVCEVMTAHYLLVFVIDPSYEDASNWNLVIFRSFLRLLKRQPHPVFYLFFAELCLLSLFFLHLSLLLSYKMQKKSSMIAYTIILLRWWTHYRQIWTSRSLLLTACLVFSCCAWGHRPDWTRSPLLPRQPWPRIGPRFHRHSSWPVCELGFLCRTHDELPFWPWAKLTQRYGLDEPTWDFIFGH